MTLKIRKPYDASSRTAISFPNATRTKQEFAKETDINTIMRKYEKTGVIDPRLQRGPGSYGDFTGATDYQTSLNQVVEAQEAFYALPSSLRARFHNDPGELLDFVSDDENYAEAVKLGLVPPPKPKEEPAPRPKASETPPSSSEEATPPKPVK